MGSPTQSEMDRRAAYLWHSLAYIAGKEAGKEGVRDLLEAGSAVSVAGLIDGSVGKAAITLPFAGILQVGHDATVASSSAPKTSDVLAIALEWMPITKRKALLVELPEVFAATGALPPIDEVLRQLAEDLLSKLRQTKQTLRRGTVRYEATKVLP